MDEDRLSPELGRLIDAAKAAAAAHRDDCGRVESWALLGADGRVWTGPTFTAALASLDAGTGRVEAGRMPGPVAAAFAVAGDPGETLLPATRAAAQTGDIGLDLPVAVKYLGRWVVVTLAEVMPV